MDKKNVESCRQSDSLSQQSRTTCSDYEDVETPRNQPTLNVHNIHRSRRPVINVVTETVTSSQEITFPNEDMCSSREHLCEFSIQLGAQGTLVKSLSSTTEDEPVYNEIDQPAQDLGSITATTGIECIKYPLKNVTTILC